MISRNEDPKVIKIKKELQYYKHNNPNASDSDLRLFVQNYANDPDFHYSIKELEDKIFMPDLSSQISQTTNDLGQLKQDRSKVAKDIDILTANRASYDDIKAKYDEVALIDKQINFKTSELDNLSNGNIENVKKSAFDDYSIRLAEQNFQNKEQAIYDLPNQNNSLSIEEKVKQIDTSRNLALLYKDWRTENYIGLDEQLYEYRKKLISDDLVKKTDILAKRESELNANPPISAEDQKELDELSNEVHESYSYSMNFPSYVVGSNIPLSPYEEQLLKNDVSSKEQVFHDEYNKFPHDKDGNLVCSEEELKKITRLKEEAQIAKTFNEYALEDYNSINDRFNKYEINLALEDQQNIGVALSSKEDEIKNKGNNATDYDKSELENFADQQKFSNGYVSYLQGADNSGIDNQSANIVAPEDNEQSIQDVEDTAEIEDESNVASEDNNEENGNFFVRGIKKAANYVRKHKTQTALIVGYLAYEGYKQYSDYNFKNNMISGLSNLNTNINNRFDKVNFNLVSNSATLSNQMNNGFNNVKQSINGLGSKLDEVKGTVEGNASHLISIDDKITNIKPTVINNNTTVVASTQTVGQQKKIQFKTPIRSQKVSVKPPSKDDFKKGTENLQSKCFDFSKQIKLLNEGFDKS